MNMSCYLLKYLVSSTFFLIIFLQKISAQEKEKKKGIEANDLDS